MVICRAVYIEPSHRSRRSQGKTVGLDDRALRRKPRVPFMNPILIVAILAISAMSVHAQGQQPDTVGLKADAQNAFNIISSDKLKIHLFCNMADLGNQLDQAERLHDTKKALEMSQKMDALEKKLPEYAALVDGLRDVDPNSQAAQEIGSMILKLDDFCGD
jgi:hypothetical protein